MADTIRIQMMTDFVIYINESQAEYIAAKSRKGAALLEYLIVNKNKPVSNRQLLSVFWSDEAVNNPENALKTLISRVRVLLNSLSPGLGACIVAGRGAYSWECPPGMEVDLYEIEDIFDNLSRNPAPEEARSLCSRLLSLYTGDLLQACEMNEWAVARAVDLHDRYIEAVLKYVALLRAQNDDAAIVRVCREALDVDRFDDQLHIELMRALVNQGRDNEALVQYEEATYLCYHYLNTEPSPELKEFYNQIMSAKRNIEFSLESLLKTLRTFEGEKGALLCDYAVFRDIFNIHMRNASRMGVTIYLGIIMVSKPDGAAMEHLKQGATIRGLIDILRSHLRRGDIITQMSPTIVAVLLPMVNYKTGDLVMERIKGLFYREYPNSDILFDYRISPVVEKQGTVAIGLPEKPVDGAPA